MFSPHRESRGKLLQCEVITTVEGAKRTIQMRKHLNSRPWLQRNDSALSIHQLVSMAQIGDRRTAGRLAILTRRKDLLQPG
ncbi:hypothetical protein SDD30_13405, partial [Moorella naiadis]|uniref:hypothetical protein n=1 Tax=Moorella naiadis (nom. illeg.) TaxID=3093670 RepID=UPI003D9CA2B2